MGSLATNRWSDTIAARYSSVGMVRTADRAIDLDQLVDGVVIRGHRDWGQLDGSFKQGIRLSIAAGDKD